MPDAKKSAIVIICSIVGCIVTLLTCGTLIGNMQGDVRGIITDVKDLKRSDDQKTIDITDMKEKQAFLEGVVSTQLSNIQSTVSRMEKQVDDLIRAE